MGLLYGEKMGVYSYKETKNYRKILKKNAALQIVKLLEKFADFKKSETEALKYGTELEIHILREVKLNNNKFYAINEDNYEVIKNMKKDKIENSLDFDFYEEFACWMLEIAPEKPFDKYLDVKAIDKHFNESASYLRKNKKIKVLFGMSTLPTIGTDNYFLDSNNRNIEIEYRKNVNTLSGSNYFLDSTITNHSRFKNLVYNTNVRRGSKTSIKIPIFQDQKTTEKIIELDHFGFGMANTCLQITYSTEDMDQARFLYDQFHVLAPLMQAFSVSSPVIAGRLLDWDCRWKIIEQAVDDRNSREIGHIEKSKYSPINLFISNDFRNKPHYNDKKFTINKKFKKTLKNSLKEKKNSFYKDTRLLNHYAYLFLREHLIVYPDLVKKDNVENTIDFEAIQSTNWNDVRFKPPANFESKLGWLVEFRSMDSPILNKEKTALVFMTTLFQRIIIDSKLGINFYVPISKIDKNFAESIKIDAITSSKFFFRKYFAECLHGKDVVKDDIVCLSLLDWLEGNSEFDGMRSLIKKFVELNSALLLQESKELGYSLIQTIWKVFDFFVARSKGLLLTSAAFIRKFVLSHKDYKHNSILSDKLMTDLMTKIICLQKHNCSISMIGNFLDNIHN
jgi:glutamate--cysteine ligase catalytic subunit